MSFLTSFPPFLPPPAVPLHSVPVASVLILHATTLSSQPATPFDAVFDLMINKVFSIVDVNGNGVIEDTEVEVVVMSLYNQVNKRLPGWQDPPSRAQIRKALAAFDTNRDGVLSKHEFCSFAKDLVNAGPSAVFQRTAMNAAKTMAGMPAAAIAMKQLQKRAPELLGLVGLGPLVKAMPVEVLAPFIGVATKFVRGMIPV